MKSERKLIAVWCGNIIKLKKIETMISDRKLELDIRYSCHCSWNFDKVITHGDRNVSALKRLDAIEEREELEKLQRRCVLYEKLFCHKLKTFSLRKRGAVVFILLGGVHTGEYCRLCGFGLSNAFPDFKEIVYTSPTMQERLFQQIENEYESIRKRYDF